jgi:hypothetical protein
MAFRIEISAAAAAAAALDAAALGGGDATAPAKSSAERTGSDVAQRGGPPRPVETPNPLDWRKACPSCNRVFTHPPAYTVHVKAALCGLSEPPPGRGEAAVAATATKSVTSSLEDSAAVIVAPVGPAHVHRNRATAAAVPVAAAGTAAGRKSWSDCNYAALIATITTSPTEARLAAMTLDDLRFLLRNNGAKNATFCAIYI